MLTAFFAFLLVFSTMVVGYACGFSSGWRDCSAWHEERRERRERG